MNELKIINTTDQTPIEVLLQVGEDNRVSARDTYEFLQLTPGQFARWSKSNITDNQFADENQDYAVVDINVDVRNNLAGMVERTITDYRLSVPFAKKLCMLSKTERGEQARDYFIKVEDKLKEIAKTGGFQVPRTYPEALRLAADYAEMNQQLAAQIEEQKPKIQLAEAVTASENSISVNELAKILKQNGVKTGRNRLMAWLRNNGFLIRTPGDEYNLPSQRSAEMGLFEVEEYTYIGSAGVIYTKFTPKITRKGQAYFIEKFCGQKVAR